MSTHKHLDILCIAVLIVTVIMTVLFMNGEALGIPVMVDEDSEKHEANQYFTQNDLNGDWSREGATTLLLDGDSVKISGGGAYPKDGGVVIASAGYYVASGELTDGSIIVDANENAKVWLMLDGVNIYCSDNAGIRVDEADKVFLTLAKGSENSVVCGEAYTDAALADKTDGAIFAHDDLTINGSGCLAVTAAYKHGIAANDDLIITGGTITVNSAADSIRANDRLNIKDADIATVSGDDGIVVASETGTLYTESGKFCLVSSDDGIHTGSDITIAGGDFEISAGDDGIHSDSAIFISDGAITVSKCYEGIEAPSIDISGGNIVLYPSDDGINASDGTASFGMIGGAKRGNGDWQAQANDNSQTVSDSNASVFLPTVTVSGGKITVINEQGQDADGIDSNGDIVINGGEIYISLNGNGSNCALDYGSESGGRCRINGGTVVAAGGASMLEEMDSASAQPSVLYVTGNHTPDGTTVSLKTAAGETVLSYEVPLGFTAVTLSCPNLAVGETYSLIIGDTTEEITVTETAATYGQSGGGFGNMGRDNSKQPNNLPNGNENSSDAVPSVPNGKTDKRPGKGDSGSQPPNDMGGETPNGNGFTQGFPNREEGTPPEMSNGEGTQNDGNTPPELPSGEQPANPSGNRPWPGSTDTDDKRLQNTDEAATTQRESPTKADAKALILPAVSAVILAAGILAVFLYKKRG